MEVDKPVATLAVMNFKLTFSSTVSFSLVATVTVLLATSLVTFLTLVIKAGIKEIQTQ